MRVLAMAATRPRPASHFGWGPLGIGCFPAGSWYPVTGRAPASTAIPPIEHDGLRLVGLEPTRALLEATGGFHLWWLPSVRRCGATRGAAGRTRRVPIGSFALGPANYPPRRRAGNVIGLRVFFRFGRAFRSGRYSVKPVADAGRRRGTVTENGLISSFSRSRRGSVLPALGHSKTKTSFGGCARVGRVRLGRSSSPPATDPATVTGGHLRPEPYLCVFNHRRAGGRRAGLAGGFLAQAAIFTTKPLAGGRVVADTKRFVFQRRVVWDLSAGHRSYDAARGDRLVATGPAEARGS